eukprot:SAG31_NODE_8169_length_1504_cov_1.909609_1_plen_501_part_11
MWLFAIDGINVAAKSFDDTMEIVRNNKRPVTLSLAVGVNVFVYSPGALGMNFEACRDGTGCVLASIDNDNPQGIETTRLQRGMQLQVIRPSGRAQISVQSMQHSDILKILHHSRRPLMLWFRSYPGQAAVCYDGATVMQSALSSSDEIMTAVRLDAKDPVAKIQHSLEQTLIAEQSNSIVHMESQNSPICAADVQTSPHSEIPSGGSDFPGPPLAGSVSPPPLQQISPPPLAATKNLRDAAAAAFLALAAAEDALKTLPIRSEQFLQIEPDSAHMQESKEITTNERDSMREKQELYALAGVTAIQDAHRREVERLRTISDEHRSIALSAKAEAEKLRVAARQHHDAGVLRAAIATRQHTDTQLDQMNKEHSRNVLNLHAKHEEAVQREQNLVAKHDSLVEEHRQKLQELAEHHQLAAMKAAQEHQLRIDAQSEDYATTVNEIKIISAEHLLQTIAFETRWLDQERHLNAEIAKLSAQQQSLQAEHDMRAQQAESEIGSCTA